MKLLKILFWIGLGFLVVSIVYKWYKCSQKGDKSGKAFCCSLFSSEPTWLIALQEYTTMRQGKCYEIIDYGKSMNYRQVELEQCGEVEPVKRQESLAEYELID